MDSFTFTNNNNNQTSHHIRSSSYPPKSNPIIRKIEQELKKLQKSEALSTSAMEKISIGLSGLAGLYKCVDDVLNLSLTQRTILDNHAIPLIDGSSKLLEISNLSKDILVRLREAIRDLQKADNSSFEGHISSYFSLRKEIVRTTRGLVLSLRQLESSLVLSDKYLIEEEVSEVIRVLRCVSIINISVLESLLQLLSVPMSKPKSKKLSLFSKLVKSSKISESGNELSNVDVVLHAVFSRGLVDEEGFLVAQKRLEALEGALKGIENGLGSISTELTNTRASLVNIISF